MKTPKLVYPSERIIYHPELSACLVCGGPLMLLNTLVWNKTVQTLDGVHSVASRPARCADPLCAGASMRLRSLAAQQVALPHTTYGYDVLVRIGWQRQTRCATYREIHADLTPQVQIAEAQVRYLYQHSYLPLLACHERQQTERLTQAAAQHGGLVIHYLRNLAEPLATRDSALTVTLRQTVRGELGPLLHADQPPDPLQPGVLWRCLRRPPTTAARLRSRACQARRS